MSDKIKVMVAIPRGGMSYTEAIDNQIEMAFYLGALEKTSNYKFYLPTIGRLFVAKAREEFAKLAIEMEMDYLMMIDDDMVCPSNLFELLVKHDVDIVAPLAFQRRKPYFPVIYKTRTGWDKVHKKTYFANEIVKNYPKDKLFECDAVGFGAVLIKIDVLKRFDPPRFMSTNPTGEDILFCYTARERLGVKVYCDTSIQIGHLASPEAVYEEDFEKMNNVSQIREVHGDYDENVHGVMA